MALSYPLVNGFRFAWSSVEIRLAGDITLGCTEINYSMKTDRAYVRGAGALPIGQTLGNYTYEADLSILVSEFDQFMGLFIDQATTQFWDIVVSYDSGIGLANGSPLSVVQDTILGATITEISAAVSSGSADALVRKLTLMPSGLLLNGVSQGPSQPTVGG